MALIGPLECGKSNLIKTIKEKFSLVIYNFSFRDITFTNLIIIYIYFNMQPNVIIVFNNINKLQISEKEIIKTTLLLLLDGIGPRDKILMKMIICSDWEKISPVIKKQGRVD